MASLKRARVDRTYEEKYQIIKYAEDNPSLTQRDAAAKYNIKSQTLSDLLKNKEKI